GFARSNVDDSLHDQFEDAHIEGIENLVFTRNDFTGVTANAVRMDGIGIDDEFFDNLQTFETGTGDDELLDMEGENEYGVVIHYKLNAGDDEFDSGFASHSYWVDGGAGNDTIELFTTGPSTIYGGSGN